MRRRPEGTGDSQRGVAISACVICYQEADRIEDCLRSLDFCDEILVLDSGSRDRSRQIAAACGARVEVNSPFPGHRQQKQLAVDLASHDWVLCLDADERISPELRSQLLALKARGPIEAGYEMPRRNQYLGKVVRRGLFWPDRKLRLFDRRRGHWGGTNPHDKVILDGGGEPGCLEGTILHLSYRDFAHHLQTIDSFTAIAAQALHAKGRRSHLGDLLLRPPAVAIKSLILKRGFLDGWRGFLIAGMACYYDFLKYWRLRRLWRQAP